MITLLFGRTFKGEGSVGGRFSELSFTDVLAFFQLNIKTVLFWVALSFALSLLLLLRMPDKYTSYAKLAPTPDSQAKNNTSSLGGVAALAGINIGSASSSRSDLALEFVRTYDFITSFLSKKDLEKAILAVSDWDPSDGTLTYDKDIVDRFFGEGGPLNSSLEFEYLLTKKFNKSLRLSVDKETGFVTVSFTHVSPFVSADVLRLLLDELNAVVKNRDIQQYSDNITYLEQGLISTSVTEMREVFYTLVEEQVKNKMLAVAKQNYVFEPIEPPRVPYKKSGPHKALFVFVLVFLGGCLALIILSLRLYLGVETGIRYSET